MTCDAIHDLILDRPHLTTEQWQTLQEHLETCADCRAELQRDDEVRHVFIRVPRSQRRPSIAIITRIQERIRGGKTFRIKEHVGGLATVALIVLLSCGAWSIMPKNRDKETAKQCELPTTSTTTPIPENPDTPVVVLPVCTPTPVAPYPSPYPTPTLTVGTATPTPVLATPTIDPYPTAIISNPPQISATRRPTTATARPSIPIPSAPVTSIPIVPSVIASNTPVPSNTAMPSNTPIPSNTTLPTPTDEPATARPIASQTPMPSATATSTPSPIPYPGYTPFPTNNPYPTPSHTAVLPSVTPTLPVVPTETMLPTASPTP